MGCEAGSRKLSEGGNGVYQETMKLRDCEIKKIGLNKRRET